MSPTQIGESDIDRLLARLNSGEPDPTRHLSLDESRRRAILNSTDVQACPGSGKTTLVGLKLMLLLENWHDAYSGICVLTHSNVGIAEILSRVGSDVAGSKLLSYPHFIGTIQDFTNTFLALPYARSREWDVHLVDESEFAKIIESAFGWNFKVHDRKENEKYQFSYYFKNGKIDASLFSFEHKDGQLKIKRTSWIVFIGSSTSKELGMTRTISSTNASGFAVTVCFVFRNVRIGETGNRFE